MDKKIGFIGGGNMAKAMIGGIISAGLVEKENVIASAKTQRTVDGLKEVYGITVTLDNTEVAKESDVLFLAVKPYMYEKIISEIADKIKSDAVIIAIAAGQSIEKVETMFGRPVHLVRVMPNTPAMVQAAMSAITPNALVTEEEKAMVMSIFESFGEAEIVPESLMDAVVGVSGSSPAYVYMFIEAMADAAVADGMPRSQAYKFAAQSVLGAAKMVLETGEHPGALKDAVCSPGGTTIEAVNTLEKEGFRSAVITAQRACSERSRQMSR